jgi:hypothetical protein
VESGRVASRRPPAAPRLPRSPPVLLLLLHTPRERERASETGTGRIFACFFFPPFPPRDFNLFYFIRSDGCCVSLGIGTGPQPGVQSDFHSPARAGRRGAPLAREEAATWGRGASLWSVETLAAGPARAPSGRSWALWACVPFVRPSWAAAAGPRASLSDSKPAVPSRR